MLKRIICLLCACLSTLAIAGKTEDVVNDTMQHYLKFSETPGAAVIVYVDGKPSSFYYGYADLASKKPVTKDTIFELGSLTKLMTTLLLAQEVDFAKIKLKEPITKYVTTLPPSFSNITVRSLATHTSGLPMYAPESVKSQAEWEEFAKTLSLSDKPDQQYQYSNVGIGLLGYAIEAVTHQNDNMLYRKKILSPLNMQPIALTVPKKLLPNYAQGYTEDGEPAAKVSDGLFPAAASMKASAEDMGKFLKAAIGLPGTPDSIFYPMRMAQSAYVEVGDNGQGLGWVVHETTSGNIRDLRKGKDSLGLSKHPVESVFPEPVVFNGNDLIDKTGTTDGFRAYIAVLPDRKSGIVVLTNKNVPGKPIVEAAREILFKLNGL